VAPSFCFILLSFHSLKDSNMTRVLVGLFLAVVVWLPGCGKSDNVKLVPVSGTVTLDGQPVADAAVSFLPQASQSPGAGATTDASGHYELTTASVQRAGACAGKYNVIVMKISETQGGSNVKGKQFTSPTPTIQIKQLLPEKYRNPATSGFTATVSESDKNVFDLPLKSK
jgi:hypothetical protein